MNINLEKYQNKIAAKCPICEQTQFEVENENLHIIKCANCKHVITKADLIENSKIDAKKHLDKIKNDVVKDISKSIKELFKKS